MRISQLENQTAIGQTNNNNYDKTIIRNRILIITLKYGLTSDPYDNKTTLLTNDQSVKFHTNFNS